MAMDASAAVSALHGLDPGFREVCDALYPGMDARQVADAVYGPGIATAGGVAKANPDSADAHVPSPVWRNGRGQTRGRGRRKIDTSVKRTVFVSKAEPKTAGRGKPSKAAQRIGLGTTAVGTGISAVALPKHLRHIPGAMRSAKTGPPIRTGMKNAMGAVRGFAKPAQGTLPGMGQGGAKAGGALKAGIRVARENPRVSAGLVLGATALHTANLGGEAIATHVLHSQGSKPRKAKTAKAWVSEAQSEIVKAYAEGLVTRAEALELGTRVAKELYGHSLTSGDIKLQTPKAPPPVKLEQPRLPVTRTGLPKPGKSGAGRKKGKELRKADEEPAAQGHSPAAQGHSVEISGEISKLNVDRQQCFGWASVVKIDGKDHIDKQNDLIEIDDIEEAAYDYVLHSRMGGDMHRRSADGGVHQAAEMIESFVLTPEKVSKMGLPSDMPLGWWIGMQVHEEDTWADVKSGRKTKFSIHGTGVRTEVLVDD